MKTIINVECMDQELVITNSPVIASGGVHENFIAFNFCSKWDGFGKTAVFYRNEKERFYSVLGPDDVCEIPHEVTDYEGTMYFGVYGEAGEVTRTSKILKYKISKGAMTTLLKPSEEPTPDIYQQLLSAYGQTNEAIARETAEREASMMAEESERNRAINTAILAEENARKQADATEKAERQTEIAVERERINALIALEETSEATDVEKEIEDIKVKADGTKAGTAGVAVREQIIGLNAKIEENTSQLSSEIAEIDELVKKGYLVKVFDWSILGTTAHPYGWMGGYYDEENGTAQTSTYHMRINNQSIIFNDKVLYFDFTPPTGYRGMVSVYNNADNTYIGKIGDVIDGEYGTIRIINNPNYGYKFTVGRFNDASGETKSLDENFVNSIKLEYMVDTSKIIVSDTSGLTISIMSDSISSYDGYVPEGNSAYYPKNGVTKPNQMWWYVMNQILGTELLVNNSWSGSCCASGVRTDTTESSSDIRCGNLGDNPNIILSCMGGNDYSYDCPIGDWNGTSTPTDTTTFKEAYAVMLNKMQKNYPNSLIICVSPWYLQRGTDNGVIYTNGLGLTESDYAKAIKEVADIFRLPFIDIASLCGFNRYNYYPTFCVDSETKPTHPNALGHEVIGKTIAQEMVKICNGYFNYLH